MWAKKLIYIVKNIIKNIEVQHLVALQNQGFPSLWIIDASGLDSALKVSIRLSLLYPVNVVYFQSRHVTFFAFFSDRFCCYAALSPLASGIGRSDVAGWRKSTN